MELASKREEEGETREKLHTCQKELEGLREELLDQVSLTAWGIAERD